MAGRRLDLSRTCDLLRRGRRGNNNEIVIDTESVLADPANMIAGLFMGGENDADVRSAHEGFIAR